MQYLVVALDGKDEEAPARRAKVRPEHLVGARALKERGAVIIGGALLNDAGGMIGSGMIFEAESEEAVREMLAADVYSRAGVWREFQIWPFRQG